MTASFHGEEGGATTGAVLAGILAQAAGGDEQAVLQAQKMGATVGARGYAKNFELEKLAREEYFMKKPNEDVYVFKIKN